MKKIQYLIILVLLISSCEKDYLSAEKYRGNFSIMSIEWSKAIDLTGYGKPTKNFLEQYKAYSDDTHWNWYNHKIMSIQQVLQDNHVFQHSDKKVEVELMLPYPIHDESKTPKKGKFYAYLNTSVFIGHIGKSGKIQIKKSYNYNIDNFNSYTNIAIYYLNRETLIFEADGYFYDYTTESLQNGHVKITLARR